MSNISSDCFFHFTPTIENLKGILNNYFYSRYSYEKTLLDINSKSPKLDAAFPMICFCDIPLSQIKEHLETYGFYGIGMRKDWGFKNKLNPVVYVNHQSDLARSFSMMIDYFKDSYSSNKFSLSVDLWRAVAFASRFLKAYTGDFSHNGKLYKEKRFYNEREWRYVPELFLSFDLPLLSENEYNDKKKRDEANIKLSKKDEAILKFEPHDIKYIIVKDESEISTMINALNEINGRKFDSEIIALLTSKILTSEQIKNDF